jgi:hypothetical protein
VRGLRRLVVIAAVVALGAAAAAFAFDSPREADAAGVLPRCVHPGASIARPAGLARLPLPDGSVLVARRAQYGYTIVRGYVPGAINPGRDFLLSRLPAAGYRLGAGDAEATEAEALFAGHGVRGKFKLNTITGCPGALTIQLAVKSAAG